ncbi:hypothetical protein IB257_25005 [Achromobacter sp. ACM03]|uniref:hypothetical protein n=1 Tax=Achromobacter sp. ACM03 TaxID=2769300 RepID=UPI001783D5EC|nr:hypothetical protein [Achromobacter sp. ACM03]MBD9433210.1 hypothetical protein [Achromobacter sp. ACM03]
MLESVRDEGSDAWVYWRPAGHVAEPDEMPLYAAPQASEAVRVQQLEAARIAYAREFPPDENGDPDVGSIHANIRKLKSQVAALSAQPGAQKKREAPYA